MFYHSLLLYVIPVIAAGVIPYFRTTDLLSLEPDRNLTELVPFANITTIAQASHLNVPAHISFVDVIYDGVRLTRSRYRRAVFQEAQATSTIGPTTDPHYLIDMRLIFSINQGAYRSVYLEMTTTWPQWGQPRLTTIDPPEEVGVLPSMFGMDIEEADRRMKAAGFRQRYDAVDIRCPGSIPDEPQQALYFFQMVGDNLDFVTVGARDGRVTPFYSVVETAETE